MPFPTESMFNYRFQKYHKISWKYKQPEENPQGIAIIVMIIKVNQVVREHQRPIDKC